MRIASKNKALRRFARSKRGSVAIEFGLVAVPFFLLTFGVAEVSVMGLAQTTLDTAVADTARDIRTGRAQMAGATGDEIEDELCANFGSFLAVDCENNLFLDVDTYQSFADVENENPIVDDELDTDSFAYTDSLPSDIVVVRAYYRWKVLTPMFERIFANASNGERIIVSTMMFRNEPF